MDENNPNNPRTPHSVSTVKSEVSLDLVFRFFTVCLLENFFFMNLKKKLLTNLD
jgi:hypothetical protein